MPFTAIDQSQYNAPVPALGGLLISWTASLPTGMVWQVYGSEVTGGLTLLWHGFQQRATVPAVQPGVTAQFVVGYCDSADAATSFAADLDPTPKARTMLSWEGGSFEEPGGTIAGFYVYAADLPGVQPDTTKPVASIPAYIGGVVTDSWNLGGYDTGGFGMVAGNYSWTSESLTSGTWIFGVAPFDVSGNIGPVALCSAVIQVPPIEPAPFPNTTTRLIYTVAPDGGFPVVTLQWLPSPG